MVPGGESCAEKEPQRSSEVLPGLFSKHSAVHAQSKTLGCLAENSLWGTVNKTGIPRVTRYWETMEFCQGEVERPQE